MHTLGPWKAERRIEVHDDSRCDEVYYSIDLDTANQTGNKRSAYIARVDGMRDERQEANARLIAAAPELLAACEAINQFYVFIESTSGHGAKGALNSVQAAIAKVRGDQ